MLQFKVECINEKATHSWMNVVGNCGLKYFPLRGINVEGTHPWKHIIDNQSVTLSLTLSGNEEVKRYISNCLGFIGIVFLQWISMKRLI